MILPPVQEVQEAQEVQHTVERAIYNGPANAYN